MPTITWAPDTGEGATPVSTQELKDRIASGAEALITLLKMSSMTEVVIPAKPPPADDTLTAEQAWAEMAVGYRVISKRGFTRHMGERGQIVTFNGEGKHAFTDEKDTCMVGLKTNAPYTRHGVHPQAHPLAMKRLIADGLKEGSTVEVMRKATSHEGGWSTFWMDDMHTSGKHEVLDIDSAFGVRLENHNGDTRRYPFQILRLVEAEPATDPKPHPAIQRVAVIAEVDYDQLVADIAAVAGGGE